MGESSETTSGLSFLSVVYPRTTGRSRSTATSWPTSGRAFRDQGIFYGTDSPQTDPGRYFPICGRRSTSTSSTTACPARVRLSEQFSLGLGVSYYQFDIDSSTTRRYNLPTSHRPVRAGRPLRRARTTPTPTSATSSSQEGNDTAWGFNLGFLWKPSDTFSLGGVYRQGPEVRLHVDA